jgi:hypothetical protein
MEPYNGGSTISGDFYITSASYHMGREGHEITISAESYGEIAIDGAVITW